MNKKTLSFFGLILIVSVSLLNCKKGNPNNNEYMTLAVAYYQRAAEVTALYHQAFNFARLSLDNSLRTYNRQKKPAVVVDIDETILDNSPYQGRMILKGLMHNRIDWARWCFLEEARATPGALDFLKYAASRGVEIFYVSNRYHKDSLNETIGNLKKLGFPNADEAHLLLKTNTSSKTERRNKVLQTHDILLFCGDNLEDFIDAFENKNSEERKALVEQLRQEFGKRFIILPNPMYGSWEGALYQHRYPNQTREKIRILQQSLTTY